MKNIIRKISIALLVTLVSACNLNGDLEDPNQITISGADVDLLMNGVQLSFADFFSSAQSAVNPLVRMEAMTGGFRYQTANTPEQANNIWMNAYQRVLINAELVIKLAQEKNLTTHIAVAKILSAYTYLTLVDIFGDVPRSNALKAETGDFNPQPDSGSEIYAYALTLLEEARVELAKTGTDAGLGLTRDIYYGGNRTRWTALANSIELKAQLNLWQVSSNKSAAAARIATLLSTDLIDSEVENFTYKYGTATVPVSRHPLYRQYYAPNAGQAGGYIANYFLYQLFNGLGVEDPRWRYYFYRQVGSINEALAIDPKSLGCAPGAPPDHYVAAGVTEYFCVFDPGFYGRNHGDGFGLPPDGPVITCAGVYPAGGRIDNTSLASSTYRGATQQGQGADGAGIEPIYMSWYTDFVKAEIAASINADPATAETFMINGINNSITQIRNFATSNNQILSPGREPSTDNYLAEVSARYAAATNKLDVIGREFYISCWGNGIEAYNNYRRTSTPRNLEPTLQLNPGPFYRSFIYPANYVNLNSSAAQKDFNATNTVFWDTNPETLN